MLDSKKSYGSAIAFILFAILSLIASFYPSNHPDAITDFNSGTIAWMLTATFLVFIMTPGLSFFYGGMVSRKNVVSTMLQSFICLGVITSLWYAVGFSLAFGEDIYGVIGNPLTYLFFDNVGLASNSSIPASITIPFVLFAFFQLKFAVITPAIITGSFAERIRFWSYVIFICLFCLFIYAPLAHWAWHPEGFLFKMGVLDFAGGTVVHISAGFAALAGAIVLGRRKSHLENKEHQPSNVAYILLGTALLWFGWFGFNAGSALDANGLAITAFINTNLASAGAMLTWVLLDAMKGRKVSALGACIGAVVGLVAITPAAGYVTYGASIFIGFFASVLSNYAVHWKNKTSIDDTLDVFPCHGIGGITGMLLTGVFAKEGFSTAGAGLIYGETTLFFNHIIALLIVGTFTFCGSWGLFKIIDLIHPLRVQDEEEKLGLDISQHNEKIYNKDDSK
jgi:Amt family ammonium transporter